MKIHRLLVALLLTVSLVSCRSAGEPTTQAANLDQEIRLAPGETVAIGQQGLIVAFREVTEDSRCPSDVTCVWAGEVKVKLSTWTKGSESLTSELKVGEQVTVEGLQIIVVSVQPERISTREIAPAEYKVTLKATRAPAQ